MSRLLIMALTLIGLVCVVSCGEEGSETSSAPVSNTETDAPDTAAKPDVRASIVKAVAFLRSAQREDGSWGGGEQGGDVGITGLVIEALAGVPDDIREGNADLLEKGIGYILANQQDDGSIVNDDGLLANYRTSIATRALIAIDPLKYTDAIEAAVRYTKGIQGKDPDDKAKFGSMGYGMSDQTKGDIINTTEALGMLHAAGVAEDDEVWQRAMIFLERTQNLDEHAEAGVRTSNDGGAIYRSVRDVEGASKAGTIRLPDGTEVPRSYGGATYALLRSLLFAGMEKGHPRVQAAYQWICDHYTVTEHPELDQQGLFYFYYSMVRTLELWGEPTIQKGDTVHNWAEELAARIISLQREDGAWVNPRDRWWESDPALVTAYSVFSLNACRRMLDQ